MIFEDRILRNPRLFRLKDPRTNEIVDFEIQDLLPEEIVQEGTEIDAAYLNGLLTYSMEEKQVGYWIDGKPLYRKVLELSISTGQTYKDESVSDLNIDKIAEIRGISQADPTATNYYETSTDKLRVFYNPNNKKVIATLGSSYPTTPCVVYVIIEYTKTTD